MCFLNPRDNSALTVVIVLYIGFILSCYVMFMHIGSIESWVSEDLTPFNVPFLFKP